MEKKKWYNSKVIWLNLIATGIEVTQLLSGINIIPSGASIIIVNALNIALRFTTKSEIGNPDKTNQI
jgi:hypothetical protein